METQTTIENQELGGCSSPAPCSTFLEWADKAGYLTCTSDIQIALEEAWNAAIQSIPQSVREYVQTPPASLALRRLGENYCELKRENARLREASQAVVDRWESPAWKDAEPTAAVIYRLRDVLSNDQDHRSLREAVQPTKE